MWRKILSYSTFVNPINQLLNVGFCQQWARCMIRWNLFTRFSWNLRRFCKSGMGRPDTWRLAKPLEQEEVRAGCLITRSSTAMPPDRQHSSRHITSSIFWCLRRWLRHVLLSQICLCLWNCKMFFSRWKVEEFASETNFDSKAWAAGSDIVSEDVRSACRWIGVQDKQGYILVRFWATL